MWNLWKKIDINLEDVEIDYSDKGSLNSIKMIFRNE